jgi:hypothetical protein
MTDDVIARLQATREAVTAGLHDARRDVIDVFVRTQAANRSRRWTTTVSVVAVAASVVAAIVLAGVATHPGVPSGTRGSSGHAAIGAAHAGGTAAYTYVRRTTVALDKRVVDEWWIPQALGGTWKYHQIGTEASTVGACSTIRAADQCPTLQADGTWRDAAGSWSEPSRQFVQGLPLDASALLDSVETDVAAHVHAGNSAPGDDPVPSPAGAVSVKSLLVIGSLQGVLESGYATPQLDVAIEQALSQMTGVVKVERATTANGTRGTGFAYEPAPQNPVRAEAIVFAADGTYIGTAVAHPAGAASPGESAGGTMSVVTSFETGQVDALGEQP